jgi:hypothetical protein
VRRVGIVAVALALLLGIGCANDNGRQTALLPVSSSPPATPVPAAEVELLKEQILTEFKVQLVEDSMASVKEVLAELSPEEREEYKRQWQESKQELERPAPTLPPEQRAEWAENLRAEWDAIEEVLDALRGIKNAEERRQYVFQELVYPELGGPVKWGIPPEVRHIIYVQLLPAMADWPRSQVETYMAALRALTPEDFTGLMHEVAEEEIAEIDAAMTE